jgi:hypothetical protein
MFFMRIKFEGMGWNCAARMSSFQGRMKADWSLRHKQLARVHALCLFAFFSTSQPSSSPLLLPHHYNCRLFQPLQSFDITLSILYHCRSAAFNEIASIGDVASTNFVLTAACLYKHTPALPSSKGSAILVFRQVHLHGMSLASSPVCTEVILTAPMSYHDVSVC